MPFIAFPSACVDPHIPVERCVNFRLYLLSAVSGHNFVPLPLTFDIVEPRGSLIAQDIATNRNPTGKILIISKLLFNKCISQKHLLTHHSLLSALQLVTNMSIFQSSSRANIPSRARLQKIFLGSVSPLVKE